MNTLWTQRTADARLAGAGAGDASRPRATTGADAIVGAVLGAMVFFVLLAAATPAIGIHRLVAPGTASRPGIDVNAVVGIFSLASTGEFTENGTGFFVKPGIVVTVHDDRRVGTDVFVRIALSKRYLAARPVEAAHPTELDVYAVDGAGTATIPLSEDAVVTGASVYLLGAPAWAQRATIRTLQDDVFAIVLTQRPISIQPGGPVLLEDGTIAGITTSVTIRDNEYLVVPVARITARLAGLPEPGPSIASLAGTPTLYAEGPPSSSASMSESRIPNDGPGSAHARPLAAARAGVVAKKARRVDNPRPEYTDEALARRIQGNVVVLVVIGTDGKVKASNVLRGLGYGLDEKAIETAMKTTFEPALDAQGNPVESELSIAINFTIR